MTRQSSEKRRGAMLPLIAILLPVMLVFLGFAVDLAYMQNTRLELRAVTDVAARAAAATLSKTENPTRARQAAKMLARRNTVAGKGLLIANQDIEFGRSERGKSGKFVYTAGARPFNAVRVTGDRQSGSRTGSVSLFFGSVFGAKDFEPRMVSTASFRHIDICLVLDRSASMKLNVNESSAQGISLSDPRICKAPDAASRWNDLHAAVQKFTNVLRSSSVDEQVAMVTYSSAFDPPDYCGTSPIAATLDIGLTGDMDAVDQTMDDVSAQLWNGSTDIESGIERGLDTLRNDPAARKAAEKVLIVMTDGYENVGNAMSAAADCRKAGVTVHSISFSADANQTLMENVAKHTDGRHLHADTTTELIEVFRELASISVQLTE